jgi:AraC family transcriptional regulator
VVVNPPASELGVRNAILTGRARQHYVGEFPGPLSIKTVVRGSARWDTSAADRLVDTSNYLILNSGRPYTLSIDSRETTETFCLFFRRGFVEEVSRVETAAPTALLDDAIPGSEGAATSASAEFFETLHPHDAIVSPIIQEIYARLAAKTATQPWLEDQFLAGAAALCRLHGEGNKRAARIPAKKPSTRVELYRRLLRGRDYMDSFFGEDVGLAEVASVACLSPYHFHRLFREVFHQTPNQYLQCRRLVNAKRLLGGGERSVTEVCLEVGFESITSFSALFRRRFGCSPREYRLRKRQAGQR